MPSWGRRALAVLALGGLVAACAGVEANESTLMRESGAPPTTSTAPVQPAETTVPEPEPVAPTEAAPTSAAPPPAPPTTAAPPPPPAAPTVVAAPVAGISAAQQVEAYIGMGTWVDVYDWSATFTGDQPRVHPADVDRMADLGVQTLYIQTSKWDAPTDILEPERLLPIIRRAQTRGIDVVGWYLPTLEDLDADFRRLMAIDGLGIGIAVDIESRRVADVDERNRRIVQLSASLREALPGRALGAIPLAPVHIEVVNPAYWPRFPWAELAPYYDVWLPMSYWTERRSDSGWRDGYRYTAENIDRVRANLGRPDALVHTIGGIADRTTPAHIEGMVRAAAERGAVGGSLYDYDISAPDVWEPLRAFRRPR